MRGALVRSVGSLTFALTCALAVSFAAPACSPSEGGDASSVTPDAGPVAPLACAAGEAAEGAECIPAGLVQCPAGTAGSDGVCKLTLPASCKAGTSKFLGETACVPIGHVACVAGTVPDATGWGCAATIAASCTGATRAVPGGSCVAIATCPSTLPAGAVRFVDDDYGPAQIDATHFASIGLALAGAPSGTVVSVAAGTYRETLVVPAGVAVIGACAGDVVIEPAVGATLAAIAATSGTVRLRALTLRGAPVGLSVEGASVSAEALVIEQSRGAGIEVHSGALELKSSVIRDTIKSASREDGVGVFALGGTTTIDDVTIDGSAGTGLSVWRASKVTARALTIVRTAKASNGTFGWGIDVESGGKLDGKRIVVSGASFAGIAATDPGSQVLLEDSVVQNVTVGTFGPGGPSLGAGLAATESAIVDVRRVTLAKTGGASVVVAGGASLTADALTARDGGGASDAIGGFFVNGGKLKATSSVVIGAVQNGVQSQEGASLTVDGLLVRDTKTTAMSSSGIGMFVSRKAVLEGKRLTLERNATAQLAATDEAIVKLEATLVIDARGGAADNFTGTGLALLADTEAKVTLSGAYFGQNKFLGVSLRRGSQLEAKGLVIDGVELANGNGGFGILAIEGTSVTLTDFAIRGAHGASLVIGEKDTKATLARGTLRDVAADKNPGLARGLSVQAGASAALERVRILGSTGTGIYLTRPGSNASFVSCVFDGVEPASDGRFGDAIQVVDGAVLRFDRSIIRNAKGAALVFAGATGAVSASLVERNAVGIHVQDGSELAEADDVPADLPENAVIITRSTQFLDNQTRVGQGVLPLPEPLPLE